MRQPRRHHTFYRQPSCTFSYYGRVGSHRYRYRRANAAFLIKPSRSMNDLYVVEARHRRRNRQRNRHRSGNTNSSSGDTESEEGEVRTYSEDASVMDLHLSRLLFSSPWSGSHSEYSVSGLRLRPPCDCCGSPC